MYSMSDAFAGQRSNNKKKKMKHKVIVYYLSKMNHTGSERKQENSNLSGVCLLGGLCLLLFF